jgi:CheY-like chemotaxis protein
MAASTWVKVVGFSDVERHSLNTLFRLSERLAPSYALWTPELPSQPHVALIDLESYEGKLEMASPRFNPNLKMISVGPVASPNAWRSFHRPVDWTALVKVLDGLFASHDNLDFDMGADAAVEKTDPPGVKISLLVGLSREDRLYLRARLSLAGMTEVDEVGTAAEAGVKLTQRQYDMVVVSLDLIDADPWMLVQSLKDMTRPVRSVVVATDAPSWRAMEMAEKLDCAALLEIPFVPQQLRDLLQKV